jgi:hypothetical protein
LDRKFSDCIRRFGAAEDETGLRQLWESVSQTSDIAAGYWALLSHPLVTAALAQRAFGEVHMLSHVSAAASRRAHTELAAARERIRDRSAALARMRTALNSKSIAKHSLEARLAVALGALAMSTRLGAEQLPESTDCDIEHLRSQIEIARAAARRARQVARERRQRMRAAEARCTKLTLALQQWQISAASQGREEAPNSASETAVGEAREPLPLDLNGQRIAYVGGRINLTSRLRAFTESHNGEFLHHDGGRHESPTRLLAVIERADVVLCPLDCVSHDACERLKRQCKRSGKRFKLLRTSSVSAFTDGLIEVESR